MIRLALHPLISLAAASEEDMESTFSSADILPLAIFGLVVLFFVWLVVAAIRKKLSTSKGRLGDFKEDEKEAARSARLWAEAKRKADEEEEEEEEEESEEKVDIQAELLEKAQARRETKKAAEAIARKPTPEPTPEPAPAATAAAVAEAKPAVKPKTVAPAPPAPTSLEDGLAKTRTGFVAKLSNMFGRGEIGEDEIEEIEEILFTADIGVRTSQKLMDILQEEASRQDRKDPAKSLQTIKESIEEMLSVKAAPIDTSAAKPFVILVVGVDGTGKTTTIGKLAMRFGREGKKVILAAGDTFRAAAKEQLQVWAKRADAQVISGQDGADPGAVIFDAINAAKSQNADVVIADTAGRLHTKVNLIEELRKIHRVCNKALAGAPHEVLLVLDATTGQNAINQAKQFHKALTVTGITLTKLDGTAKGGIIIGVCDTFGIPVRYIGIGEQVEDLRPFDPSAFVKALFS
ncbi:MAG: signal recognition particle-docking protein FtsY [Caldiserica bacterium]|nr:MAG: signal recognition particle-docking protein FtsY [Caldisericota bacterium]